MKQDTLSDLLNCAGLEKQLQGLLAQELMFKIAKSELCCRPKMFKCNNVFFFFKISICP